MKKKRIFTYGFRQINLGDDLFFYILFSRYQQVDFVFCAPRKYKEIFGGFDNVKIYTENRFLLAINRILINLFRGRNIRTLISRSCDAGVLIIGTYFGERKDGKNRYYYEPSPRVLKDVFVISANVANVYTDRHLEKVGGFLEECSDVCFREVRSRELFSNLSNVRMAPDVVFQLGKKKQRIPVRKKVLFSVVDMYSRNHLKSYAEEYEQLIRKLMDYFNRAEYEISFMSFCDSEGDDRFIKKLVDKCQNVAIEVCSYQGNINDTLEKIQESEIVIATRFHSMILAWAYRKKVLPIVYDSKMQHVIDDYQYKGSYIRMDNMGEFGETAIARWLDEKIFDAADCIERSEEQFKGLDEYINGK